MISSTKPSLSTKRATPMATTLLPRGLLLLSLSLTVLLSSALAIAQDLAPEEMERFQGYVRQGSELIENREFREGLQQLQKARDMIDHPTISLSIARAYRDWGRCANAQEEYTNLLEREGLSDEIRAAIVRGLRLMPECQELAEVRISCDPEDVLLTLQSQSYHCPLQEDLPVGEYLLSASAEGYEDFQKSFRLGPDDLLELDVVLIEIAQVPSAELPAVSSGEEDDRSLLRYAGLASAGVGLGLLAGGFIVDLGASSRTDEIAFASAENDRARLAELEEEAKSARLSAGLLYGSGLFFVGGGLAFHFLYPSLFNQDKDRSQSYLRPSLEFGPTSVQSTWRW